jgi:alkanesulfonate monooxygenase SsuD/methylene tetrahydromethanopterin reductase-like flavin-dependent oxidoreductase (luciferase family)
MDIDINRLFGFSRYCVRPTYNTIFPIELVVYWAPAQWFPGPHETSWRSWNEADDALVRDRVDTQFVGSPKTVTQQLAQLQEATAADELIVTTITHIHEDRRRSPILLAREWCARSPRTPRWDDASVG